MKRILWIMPYFENFGGAERVALNVTKSLSDYYEVTLVLLKPGVINNYSVDGRVRVETLLPQDARLRTSFPGVIRSLWKLARSHDLIIAGLELNPTYLSVTLGTLARRPTIAICHIGLDEYLTARGLSNRHRRLSRVAYRRSKSVVAVANSVGEQLRDKIGVPDANISVLPNAVNRSEIETLAGEQPEWIPPAKRYLVSIGRLDRQKGFGTLIRAMSYLVDDQQIHLVILGEGDARAELEELIANSGLSDRIHLPGFLKNPYPLLANAVACVIPSRYEGLPIVLLEAFALGKPVVASRIPAIVQATEGEGGVVLVPKNNPEALGNAIGRLLSDESLRIRLSAESRLQADRFDLRSVIGKWRDVIDDVIV